MGTYDVEFLAPKANGTFATVTVAVEAENRGKAITAASRKTKLHRDMVLSAKARNPAPGGGGLVGHR